MDEYKTWCEGRPPPRSRCVRWGPIPTFKKGAHFQFSAHVCRGQTAGWIKKPLDTEAGLGSGNIVLYRDPAPVLHKGTASPHLRHAYCGQMSACIKVPHGTEVGPVFLLRPNSWMDQNVTWYEDTPRQRLHCVRDGP